MSRNIIELLEIIKKLKANNQLRKYIDFIQFPFYRNMELNTRITFNFPLTVFIGQNGSGKSSCLHALYGAPRGNTPYDFWFDTKVDPVSYYDEERKRHSFWYSFKDIDGNSKEVIKARIKRDDNPNYWETSRPLVWAGMRIRRNIDKRDAPINKNVIYLDFRSELSAFDKFFYFGNVKNLKSANKQEFIRRKSASLNNLLSQRKSVIKSAKGIPINRPIRTLSSSELEWISFILGKEYLGAKFLEHSLYRSNGYSVLFTRNTGNYSEAFAGSGEVAVVRLVLEILDAEEYSLILLDEPEVSLHPGAQKRLKQFLLDQIKIKKHQIILSSHSPSLISELPKEAVKVFFQNPDTNRFSVKENLSPQEAFYHIEQTVDNLNNIIVEDILAKNIIEAVLNKMGADTYSLFKIIFNPGGESVIKENFITVYCRDTNSNNYIFFDGDQKSKKEHYDWRNFQINELNSDFLQQKIREQVGSMIKFPVDGGSSGGNPEQKIELLKLYLDYFKTNVFYLPEKIPEEIIWGMIPKWKNMFKTVRKIL